MWHHSKRGGGSGEGGSREGGGGEGEGGDLDVTGIVRSLIRESLLSKWKERKPFKNKCSDKYNIEVKLYLIISTSKQVKYYIMKNQNKSLCFRTVI